MVIHIISNVVNGKIGVIPPTPTIRQITFANLEIMRTKTFHRFICQNSLLLLHIDSVQRNTIRSTQMIFFTIVFLTLFVQFVEQITKITDL